MLHTDDEKLPVQSLIPALSLQAGLYGRKVLNDLGADPSGAEKMNYKMTELVHHQIAITGRGIVSSPCDAIGKASKLVCASSVMKMKSLNR